MKLKKTVLGSILSHLIGLVIFIILLIIANIYIKTENTSILQIILFLNQNLSRIILITLTFMIADIFYTLSFPFSFPAPIFSATGALLVISFIFRIFALFDVLLNDSIFGPVNWIKWIIYPVVFVITIVSGYIRIFFKIFSSGSTPSKSQDDIIDVSPKKSRVSASWKKIGEEFRSLVYELVVKIRKSLNRIKKK